MALAPLATVADLTARGVTIDPADEDVAATFLAVASAAIREAAGVPIAPQVESTVSGLFADDSLWLTLPGPPVVSVSSVSVDGAPVTDWTLRNGRIRRAAGWNGDVTATYTHGLPSPPADLVDLTCRLALAGFNASQNGSLAASNVWQERIGDYFVMYRQDSGSTSEMDLPSGLRARIAARFGGGANILVSR